MDSIKFANKIMTDSVRGKGDNHLRYKMVKWEKIGEFDILNDISDHVTLVQLIDTAVIVNNAVSVIGCWTYTSHKKSTSFNQRIPGYSLFSF